MQKFLKFSTDLISWYQKNARDLPWRHTHDPYKIWISEIMLQQTTVAAVIPYYLRWIKTFPNIRDVAKAPLRKILRQWQGLGYYQRAKNIHQSAQLIVEKYQAQIPRDPDLLGTLPGFGPYTIGAVLSIAYGIPLPIIDANIRRVVMRILGERGKADLSRDPKINKFLIKVFPKNEANRFNQAFMELGALICRSRDPQCLKCPVRKYCAAYHKGIQEIIPEPKSTKIQKLKVVVGVIENHGKYFIQQRPSKGLLADLWEFPGGKIEKGETALQALKRELKEEIECDVESAAHLMDVRHYYTQYAVDLSVWKCILNNTPQKNSQRRWVNLRELNQYPMPSGSARIVDRLIKKG